MGEKDAWHGDEPLTVSAEEGAEAVEAGIGRIRRAALLVCDYVQEE